MMTVDKTACICRRISLMNNKYSSPVIKKNLDTTTRGLSWYLVQCKPNTTQIAVRNLENQSFTTFLPLQESTKRKGKKFQRQIRPLFPGYLFVQLNPAQGPWRQVNNTRGVARLVRLSTLPSVVPESIIVELLARCDEQGVLRQARESQNNQLRSGEQVEVTQGPFSGIVATVTNVEPNDRIYILFDIMGQKTKLEIEGIALQPNS